MARGALRLRQIGRVAQPDVAGAAQQASPLLFGTAHLVDRVVDDPDGMELVERFGARRFGRRSLTGQRVGAVYRYRVPRRPILERQCESKHRAVGLVWHRR